MLSIRGVWSTYLIVENIDNPADNHIIRINLEVVAKQNIKRLTSISLPFTTTSDIMNTKIFDVFADGIPGKESSIFMGDICLGTLYNSRSLTIYNRESVPLDFSLKSNLAIDQPMELVFSLSRTDCCIFKKVAIEPESHATIYLHFWPGSCYGSMNMECVRRLNLEIYVNCRLVKDYQMM
jgi:hypothetical protein